MKVALLADIHGNIEALRAVLAQVNSSEADKILIAGDFVGYYYHPHEVIETICRLGSRVEAIKGNHDALLEDFNEYDPGEKENIRSKYGSGEEIAIRAMAGEQKQWLCSLKEQKSLYLDGSLRRQASLNGRLQGSLPLLPIKILLTMRK